jgi:PTK7 protein tyrosine kinase 7
MLTFFGVVAGKGHYGDVFLAKAHGIMDGEPETLVVVKSLLTRDEAHHFEFRREMDLFNKLNHEHVVKLLGVCREMEPQFLITEYCEWVRPRSVATFPFTNFLPFLQGDLKQFLWATRPDNGKRNVKLPPLTIAQKVTMCQQVALGMEHLANHRFVHKDLATRNVLLSSNLDLKITMLCLCRDVYANEYFPFHQQLLPLRWMPPEAILDDDYSTKSDVWSFGVFVWEIFTQADLPYRQRTDEDVLRGLKTYENRLEAMRGCPENLANLVAQCMAANPKERPSFSEIALIVGEMTVDSNV